MEGHNSLGSPGSLGVLWAPRSQETKADGGTLESTGDPCNPSQPLDQRDARALMVLIEGESKLQQSLHCLSGHGQTQRKMTRQRKTL